MALEYYFSHVLIVGFKINVTVKKHEMFSPLNVFVQLFGLP